MIAYKIVRRINNKLFSLTESEWTVRYTPNVWIYPNEEFLVSYLFVFKSVENAQDFISKKLSQDTNLEIWKCETKIVIKTIPHRRPHPSMFKNFWSYLLNTKVKHKNLNKAYCEYDGYTSYDSNFPNGTLFSKAVKLIEKVK